ncbi:sulfotransferase family protein [Leptothoe spongobia]|uniref:Sulfotransferase n=1 Tax=Leptothoe spongobia TAU-MAC 1115 TaxID=1967444 RepID=A0A947DHK1_9CYAN|nr:sulfotransferase [Leptothoe spongobia]MBT9317287.1 sulfotransferase [Leptothoe spongobia TAU-MAC 1115]
MYKSPGIFIVSSGRSGTTLLVSILNATKQIFIPYESDFVARAFSLYAQKKAFSKSDYLDLVDIFYRSSQPQGWGMNKDFLCDYLCKYRPQNFSAVHSRICQAYHEQHGTTNLIWGIKAPVLIASLDRIKRIHPSSKILHIVRDGRDVYLSYKKVHRKNSIKFGPKNLLENALYWVDGLRRIEDYGESDKVYELKYETILQNPDVELKRLCSFLGVKYSSYIHEKFQSFEKNRALVPEKLSEALHEKVHSGIDATNSKKYKGQMSVFHRFVFEVLASPYLEKYDYEIEFPWLGSSLFYLPRFLLYKTARLINDWRYARRDLKTALKSE